MPGPLTRDERERFLAALHVGVVCVTDGARGPLASPVWYVYEPGGEIVFCTREQTRKARLLEVGTRVSFLAQVEGDIAKGVLPQYVSVEGPIVKLEAANLERDLRPIVHRYLGAQVGDGYLKARPERWLTRSFGA
jgi:nitroimidazol reductase NimA-like FMN-containing flavoprotein (pyridoxamine 5'-phosphate oxidase superfamily)